MVQGISNISGLRSDSWHYCTEDPEAENLLHDDNTRALQITCQGGDAVGGVILVDLNPNENGVSRLIGELEFAVSTSTKLGIVSLPVLASAPAPG
jgi:hypothetical protein